jgi:putative ABC transport system substrate-binding protein
MTTRRAFLAGALATALGASPAARAQQAGRVRRIGFFGPPPGTGGQLVQSFQQGLRDLGYIEGQSITIDYRWTDLDARQLEVLAHELVRLKVEVLVASV